MDKGISFKSIKNFLSKIWLLTLIGLIVGAVIGYSYGKISGPKYLYKASSSIYIDRNFDVDQNGNGFYDQDSGKFWGNFLSFIEYPEFVETIKEKYPNFDENNLGKKYPNFSNVLEINYESTNKNEAIGVVNDLVNQLTNQSNELLKDKANLTIISQPSDNELSTKKMDSASGNLIIGALYGLIVGFVIAFIKFIKQN